MNEIEKYANPDVCTMIVGNKSDMEYKKKVEYEKGASLAKQYKIPFIEVSAKEGYNIQEIFNIIMQKMHKERSTDDTKKGTTVLTIAADNKTAQCC